MSFPLEKRWRPATGCFSAHVWQRYVSATQDPSLILIKIMLPNIKNEDGPESTVMNLRKPYKCLREKLFKNPGKFNNVFQWMHTYSGRKHQVLNFCNPHILPYIPTSVYSLSLVTQCENVTKFVFWCDFFCVNTICCHLIHWFVLSLWYIYIITIVYNILLQCVTRPFLLCDHVLIYNKIVTCRTKQCGRWYRMK